MSEPERKYTDAPGPTPWGHNYIDVNAMEWEPSRLPKSQQKVLYSDEKSGMSTILFRMEPGGVIPYHEHPEIEQTYILKGKLVDHLGECTAGNFVCRLPGARCPEGAEFIVFFMKPPLRLPEP